MNLGQLVALVFIDSKKAFDTLDHEIICEKLKIYIAQQRGLVVKVLPIHERTILQGKWCFSGLENIEVGVPQGSYLRLLLFLIYINNIPLAVGGSTVSMYADHTSLYH